MTRAHIEQPLTGARPGTPHDFEAMYQAANGDRTLLRWDDGRPNPLLVDWLDHDAVDALRTGARVVVVGCGLGHDARELAKRGYDVTAFDVSPTAIDWARTLDTEWAEIFCVADVLALPTRWRRRFDLVVEVNTIQSLPPAQRSNCVSAVESLLHPHGALLLICRGAERPQQLDDGPPWALTTDELRELAAAHGLATSGFEVSTDDEDPPKRRIRALLRRSAAR